eukprot:c36507_g1_i1.p1 GENE.c36507_g1_i1~~c36507_g1_i1.p1  ORF type:complete len:153 (+),score=34.36 c36507_g1_i1:43-501(+)
MSRLVVSTALGQIHLQLLPDAAPATVQYISELANSGLYDNTSFYRSDFVIQCGTHGTNKTHNFGPLRVNETHQHRKVSNTRGTAAVAHWDVPDCGNSEFFINLQANTHLDTVYGGYCVFAQVEDDASFSVVDAIAEHVKSSGKVAILSIRAH